jgi:hypothetical protein
MQSQEELIEGLVTGPGSEDPVEAQAERLGPFAGGVICVDFEVSIKVPDQRSPPLLGLDLGGPGGGELVNECGSR